MAGEFRPLDEASGELRVALPAYEIGEIIGSGAFAVVFAGRHIGLDREVAIKVLAPALVDDDDARQRFGAEARLLASLDHPHIVRVHDYVEGGDVCALVMERTHGGTLAARLRLGRLSPARACAVGLATLHGLEHAHRHKVLHRDVKPENLLFAAGNLLKVADFGIAKMVGASGARLTATATRPGTPAFMAPEQVSSSLGPLSPATDVWAAGAVMHELLAGKPPFADAVELGDALLRRATTDARPLAEAAPGAPAPIAAVVDRSLARDQADRFASAGEFAEALEDAAGRALGPDAISSCGIPVHRTAPLPAARDRPTVQEESALDLVEPPVRRKGRRGPVAVLVPVLMLLLAGLAVLGIFLASNGGGEASGLAALPSPPPGWPKSMVLSYVDEADGPAGVAKRLGAGASTWGLFDGDPLAGTDWSQDPKRSPARFARSAHRHGLFPYAIYYALRAVGRNGQADAEAPQMRKTLVNPRRMRAYWENVRKFLRSLGSTHLPAAVTIESGVFPELEQQLLFSGQSPESVAARVGDSGLPELRGLPDNLLGLAQGWRALRNRYAPKVLLGVEMDDYGDNVDISRDMPPKPSLLAGADAVGSFYLDVAANDFDYIGLEIAYSEEGQNPSRTEVYSPAEKQGVVDFARELVRRSQTPVVLDSVPTGNTASQAITDRPFHWRDSWVQWLMGDGDFSGLRELRDAGVIGVIFSATSGRYGTCPCDAAGDGVTNGGKHGKPSTSADDDGGYFAERAAALDKAGGMPLR